MFAKASEESSILAGRNTGLQNLDFRFKMFYGKRTALPVFLQIPKGNARPGSFAYKFLGEILKRCISPGQNKLGGLRTPSAFISIISLVPVVPFIPNTTTSILCGAFLGNPRNPRLTGHKAP